jgi:hypothetical protein
MILLLLLPNFKLLDLTLIILKLCKSGKRKKGEKGDESKNISSSTSVSGILRL